jgi:S-adenosylmethionine synthetase
MPLCNTLFTSESVTGGHPDKLSDQISDSILDACLAIDPTARVAVETMVKGMEELGYIIIAGEVTLLGEMPDFEAVARAAAVAAGYDDHQIGMDARSESTCSVISLITAQAPDISRGVSQGDETQGAGDQGLMFGFACDETEGYPTLQGRFMPLPAALAQGLCRRLTSIRESGAADWSRPDGKSMVTVEYGEDGTPLRVDTIVVAIQHADLVVKFGSVEAEQEFIGAEIDRLVIRHEIPAELIDDKTRIIVNGTGRFGDPGGPRADAGLTGRKIIVDTYGGRGRHGGGAFSGKDSSKVDRSAAYAARWAAKHVVAAGLASECEIQLAYAIGEAWPVSISVDSHGTGSMSDDEIAKRVSAQFDFRPHCIIRDLGLTEPIFYASAAGGHFGRSSEDGFPWERIDATIVEHLSS